MRILNTKEITTNTPNKNLFFKRNFHLPAMADIMDRFTRSGARFERLTSFNEKKDFIRIFIEEVYKKRNENKKGLSLILEKIRKISDQLHYKKFSKVTEIEAIKDSEGKVIGGFGFRINNDYMELGAFFLDSATRGTEKGKELVLLIVQRIKQIAIEKNADKIYCNVYKDAKGLREMYHALGFRPESQQISKKFIDLEVLTKDFGADIL